MKERFITCYFSLSVHSGMHFYIITVEFMFSNQMRLESSARLSVLRAYNLPAGRACLQIKHSDQVTLPRLRLLLKTVFLGTSCKTNIPICGTLPFQHVVHAPLPNMGEHLKHWTYVEPHIRPWKGNLK